MASGRWKSLIFVTFAVAVGLWSLWLEPASIRVQEISLELKWPYARPLRVTLVSDLHVGSPYQGLSRLPSTVDRINATAPDIICLAGDFVTLGVLGGRVVPPEAIARELARLQAPGGVFAVLGNHDRGYDGDRVRRALSRSGIRVLEDTSVAVLTLSGRIWVTGVSDFWTGPHDIQRALHMVTDSTAPILLLTHNPDLFPRIPSRVMLTLAGHTHGGQVRLPLIGAPVVPSEFGQRYVHGHVVENGRHLFVSTGIGTSDIPIRFGVPPTIFVLTLRAVPPDGPSRPRSTAKHRAHEAEIRSRPRTARESFEGSGAWAHRSGVHSCRISPALGPPAPPGAAARACW
jgi:predicted MPP superfamily phosphohydrolase